MSSHPLSTSAPLVANYLRPEQEALLTDQFLQIVSLPVSLSLLFTPHHLLNTLGRSISLSPSLQDIILVLALVYVSQTYFHKITPESNLLGAYGVSYPTLYPTLWYAAWGVYGYAMGLVMLGLFHIGHECGHGAFCRSRAVNTIIGYIVHSA